jgi:hypothetical protein
MKKVLAAGIAAATLVAAAPAHAQMNPRSAPRSTGPLGSSPKRCQSDNLRAAGRVRGRLVVCAFSFGLNSAVDGNPNRDFGAVWIQASINPTNGWCAVRAPLSVVRPNNTRVVSVTPRALRARRARSHVARLTIGGPAAKRVGRLRKGFTVFPRRLRRTFRPGPGRLTAMWNGRTRNTVAVVAGLEVSWREALNPSGGRFRFFPAVARC